MKKIIMTAIVLLTLLISGCTTIAEDKNSTPMPGNITTSANDQPQYNVDDLNTSWNELSTTNIQLKIDSIKIEGSGAISNGQIVTITTPGAYSLNGKLNNGQIRIDTSLPGTVHLIFNGVNISCSTSSPIYVVNADKTVITLADKSENYLVDGTNYVFDNEENNEPNAALFSKDDLTINGNGSLSITGNFNNGIQCKDDLKITGGIITVTAVNGGIKGRDSVTIKKGTINITAGGDGIQSNNDTDPAKGYVVIEGGTFNINTSEDGI